MPDIFTSINAMPGLQSIWIGVLVGALFASFLVWLLSYLVFKARLNERSADVDREAAKLFERVRLREEQLEKTRAELQRAILEKEESDIKRAELQSRLKASDEHIQRHKEFLTNAEKSLANAFSSLSSKALNQNQESFLRLANTKFAETHRQNKGELEKKEQAFASLINPVKESLFRFDENVKELESKRELAYQSIKDQVAHLSVAQKELKREASRLTQAFSQPNTRGRWGEIQLQRAVEIAGMQEHCDFLTQKDIGSSTKLRPDMLIKMPGERQVVVDAKTPLSAYLSAIECEDEKKREGLLADHARQVRSHVDNLSRKAYWESLAKTPEFVVLFLPGESFFAAALRSDPKLIEDAMDKRVLLASPVTLIALLRSVAYGWRQDSLARNARVVSELGAEFYKRLNSLHGHFTKLGRSLNSSVDCYNGAMRSLESRVLVSARKFEELKVAPDKEKIEQAPLLEKRALAVTSNDDADEAEKSKNAKLEQYKTEQLKARSVNKIMSKGDIDTVASKDIAAKRAVDSDDNLDLNTDDLDLFLSEELNFEEDLQEKGR